MKGERVVVAENMLGFAVISGTQDEIVESSHRSREADPGLGTEKETFVMKYCTSRNSCVHRLEHLPVI